MKTKAFIYIVIAGILWGTAGIFVHYLAPFGFSSLQMTAIRGSVAAIAMTVYRFFFNRFPEDRFCHFVPNQYLRIVQ